MEMLFIMQVVVEGVTMADQIPVVLADKVGEELLLDSPLLIQVVLELMQQVVEVVVLVILDLVLVMVATVVPES
jgi:hypothetical protein